MNHENNWPNKAQMAALKWDSNQSETARLIELAVNEVELDAIHYMHRKKGQ